MNEHHKIALANHCRFGFETAHPQFGYMHQEGKLSVVLSVNSGYE